MTKVIISHDVDHLYAKDHWFRDLIYPKLWIRSTKEFICREISLKEWWLRCSSCFKRNRNCISELVGFDKSHGVESVFFFGVKQGLGMSYLPREAKPMVEYVKNEGFAVGLHGICFDDYMGIKDEYDTFREYFGFEPCGIRMHYVRYDDNTFENEDKAGYVFDSSEFEKTKKGNLSVNGRCPSVL